MMKGLKESKAPVKNILYECRYKFDGRKYTSQQKYNMQVSCKEPKVNVKNQ